MQQKDKISKRLLKKIALDMARLLLKLDLDDVELLDGETARIEERRADLMVKAVSRKGDYILHVEIQNDNQRLMPWRMLRYSTDIAFVYPGIPVRQYVLYIGNAPLNMLPEITEEHLQYRYHIIDLREVDAETLLEQDTPDAIVMAVLCDFHGKSDRSIVRRILQKLSALTGADEAGFRDYLLMLEVLASNRDLANLIQEEEAMLSQVKYSDLPSYHLGKKEGVQLGMQQGMQEGLQQGEAEIILLLLHSKFGQVSEAMESQIRESDAQALRTMAERVLKVDSLDKLFAE